MHPPLPIDKLPSSDDVHRLVLQLEHLLSPISWEKDGIRYLLLPHWSTLEPYKGFMMLDTTDLIDAFWNAYHRLWESEDHPPDHKQLDDSLDAYEYWEQLELRARTRKETITLLRIGKLIRKPCRICGARAEMHHLDYADPSAIDWLCRIHHPRARSA